MKTAFKHLVPLWMALIAVQAQGEQIYLDNMTKIFAIQRECDGCSGLYEESLEQACTGLSGAETHAMHVMR